MKTVQYVFDAKLRCLAPYPDKIITMEGPPNHPHEAEDQAYNWIVQGTAMSAWDLTLRDANKADRSPLAPKFRGISIVLKAGETGE